MSTENDYQPTPWFHDGSRILNSSFRALATISFPADARRIVACGWLKIDPNFDPLRKNPRFQKLVASAK
jgi:hypothetical protein